MSCISVVVAKIKSDNSELHNVIRMLCSSKSVENNNETSSINRTSILVYTCSLLVCQMSGDNSKEKIEKL
jgi:hypothetical protein